MYIEIKFLAFTVIADCKLPQADKIPMSQKKYSWQHRPWCETTKFLSVCLTRHRTCKKVRVCLQGLRSGCSLSSRCQQTVCAPFSVGMR